MSTVTGHILWFNPIMKFGRALTSDGQDVFVHQYDFRPIYHDDCKPYFDPQERQRGPRPRYLPLPEEGQEIVLEISESSDGQPKAFPWAYKDPVDWL